MKQYNQRNQNEAIKEKIKTLKLQFRLTDYDSSNPTPEN